MRHVVVVTTVPLIYPTIPGVEEAMMYMAGTGMMQNALSAFLQKTGLSQHIYSQFGGWSGARGAGLGRAWAKCAHEGCLLVLGGGPGSG